MVSPSAVLNSPPAEAVSAVKPNKAPSSIQPIRVCFGLTLLSLAVVAGSAEYFTARFLDLTRQIAQTNYGLETTAGLVSILQAGELGQRSYLLTQAAADLEPYLAAIQALPDRMAAVQSWSDVRSAYVPEVARISLFSQQLCALWKQEIMLNDQQGLPAALALVGSGEGMRLMGKIGAAASSIDSRERQLLTSLLPRSITIGRWSHRTVLTSTLLAWLLVGMWLLVNARDVARRKGTETATRERAAEFVVVNENLRLENQDRQSAQRAHQQSEEEVRALNTQLESRVSHRTSFLEAANDGVRALNVSLEELVSERTAQLEAANRELEAFSYSVSHDLRAPLRAINGFSQALQEEAADVLNETSQEYLGRIVKATKRMGQLIDDLLSLARVSRSPLVRQSVDLTAVVGSVLADLRELEPQRQVDTVVAENVVADGDPTLIRVALLNLLENAWKFSSKRPLAKIEFGVSDADGSRVFFVRDNGAGFDPTYAGKLFGVFQRLHSIEEFAGSGIGLATVQRIIHRHGGRLWADAKPGEGATFYFSL